MKKQHPWFHVLFIAIAVIGLLTNKGLIFLIGLICEIVYLWRIYQKKKAPVGSDKSAHKASQAPANDKPKAQHQQHQADHAQAHHDDQQQHDHQAHQGEHHHDQHHDEQK